MLSNKLYLVTGANGYLATHIVSQLLKQGFRVRGTVRDPNDVKKVEALRRVAKGNEDKLELVKGDLLDPDCWKEAVKGCNKIMHVATPHTASLMDDEAESIRQAVNGMLNVLKAAADEPSVERIVYTGSGLTFYGNQQNAEARTYTENDRADPNKLQGYAKSKYLAEKAAWDFIEERKKNNQHCFEFSIVIPLFILGPALNDTIGVSEQRFLDVLENKHKKLPNIYYPTCDVRDVAKAHIVASIIPEAVNNRFIITSEKNFIPMVRWAQILNEHYGLKLTTEVEENAALDINIMTKAEFDNSRMRNVLKIEPIDFKSTIIDMAEGFIKSGRVKL